MAISGLIGAVYKQTTAASAAFVGTATTADATYTNYTIADPTKHYLDDTKTTTVYKNGVPVSSGFTIEYCGGVVVFNPALLGTDVVTVDGSAFTVAQVAGIAGWKLDINADMEDTSAFDSGGYKAFTATTVGWNGSCDGFWVNMDMTTQLVNGGKTVIVLYVDDSANKKRYEGYGLFKKDSLDNQVKSVLKESVDFEGTEKIYYREG